MSVIDPVWEEHTFAPDEMSRVAAVVSAFEVEYTLAATVKRWMAFYLAEMEAQRALKEGGLPELRSIVTSADGTRFPEEQLPALIISSTGLDDPPDVRADGLYTARWRVDCRVVVSSQGNRQARRLAALYAAMVRALIIQRASQEAEGQLHLHVDWRGENYTARFLEDERTRAEAVVALRVQVAEATWRFGGPYGIAETVDVEVKKKGDP